MSTSTPMTNMDSTPGAGPSKPRQSSTLATATATLEPPTPKSRRRSWFPFGSSASASASATSSTEMPPPPLPPTTSSRKSKKGGKEPEVALELSPMTPRQSVDMAMSRSRSSNGDKGAGEEVLTIDGQIDSEVEREKNKNLMASMKKKKKKRRSKGEDEEGEAMRMTDFKPARRTSTASDTSCRTEMPNGNQLAFTERAFTRTASDRLSFPETHPSGFVKPPPRISSISSVPPGKIDRIPSDTSNKEQPPIPVDRPLPPLPPQQASPSGSGSTPPARPAEIVVTPSSPQKDRHDNERGRGYRHHDSKSLGAAGDEMRFDRRSRSEKGSRDRDRDRERTIRSSPIGLGLPRQLVPHDNDHDHPPPVPSKKQSVSTPLPSRTPSPIPRIAFIEPDEPHEDRGRTPTVSRNGTKNVKRARSLSGIFKSSPVVTSVTPTHSLPGTPDPKDGEEQQQEGAGGLMGWLGMKKTIKRRQSETHLRQGANKADQPQPDIPRVPSPVPRASHDSQTAVRSTRSSFVDLVSRGSQDSASRPPSRNSSTAILAASPSKKLGSLFTRRQSSKQTESGSSTGPSPPLPLPTKSNSHQQSSGATSSRSSFSLPPFDTSLSPIYPQSGPWMSSPATEMDEEMLFSPESGSNWGPGMRPWMDGTDPPQRSARTSLSSPPMGSLPERGILEGNMDRTHSPDGEGQSRTQNRGRSHSDAPPPGAVNIQDPQSGSHRSPGDSPGLRLAASLSSSPVAGSRPKLGNRANSGNAAIIDRMKTVFARNSSRQRASTLLPEPTYSVHVDEFGAIRHSQDEPPSNASSALFSSPQQANGGRVSFDDPAHSHGSLLGLQDAERRRIHPDNGSNRSSIAASIASQATSTSAQLPTPAASDMRKERSFIGRARPRASTMSSGPTNQPFTPPSPVIFPAAATPPRRRPSAIRKLSNTLLGTSPRLGAAPSPKSSSLFPLPPRSSGSISSGLTHGSVLGVDDTPGPTSTASPRPSLGSIVAPPTSAVPNFKQIAKRQGEETPEQYVDRISSIIPRNEIAGALATSSDSFFFEALKRYMGRFDFEHQPLDIALRQLLMHMSLPKETQQIDRVMEAFAARYEECEPSLFKQHDNTYVLAFSMMMLHTDAFNKHNKNKMSKADYVRNTRLDGVSSLVLEAFYDNITFTPFVFIDDDDDLQPANTSPDIGTPSSSGVSTPGSMPPPKSSKIDVYHMIVNRQLRALQVDIEKYIPSLNPYSCQGSALALDTDALHQTFTKAQLLQVTLPGRRKTSTGILSSTPTRGAPSVEVTLKVVRVGQLSRVDDTHENGKKSSSNRKWKSWSVILTGTQLLFFKDPSWATTLQERSRRLANDPTDQSLLLPPTSTFKPDEVFPLKDCVAVFDQSSSQLSTSTTFRFVMPQGRQYLLSAPDQMEMNDWIRLINYAAAFKTAGVKMRGVAMNKDQAVLAGAAAAASHKRDVQGSTVVTSTPRSSSSSETGPTTISSSIVITTPKKAIFGDPQSQSQQRQSHDITGPPVTPSKSDTLKVEKENAKTIDVDAADDVVVDEGEQLEKVFDVVKAELAAGRGGATATRKQSHAYRPNSDGSDTLPLPLPLNANADSNANGSTAGASRASALMSQIERYTTKRNLITTQLDSYTITTRNLAILAPFQKITRDRIITALSPLSESIKADRIQWIKYDTWTQILQQDLEKDEQEWARVRHVALQAAAKSLKDPKGVKGVVDDVNASANGYGSGNRDVPTTLPRLSLPDSTESGSSYSSPVSPLDGIGSGSGSGLGSSPGELPIIIRRPSTTDDLQRHSHTHTHDHTSANAKNGNGNQGRPRQRDRERTIRPNSSSNSNSQREREHGEGVPQSRPRYYRSNSSFLSADEHDHGTTSPPTGRSTPLMFNLSETEDNPSGPETRTSRAPPPPPSSNNQGGDKKQKQKQGEEAEDWEKTRASKRVSLASVEIPEGEMRKLSLKKRDREVTARYIGPDPDKDKGKSDMSGH